MSQNNGGKPKHPVDFLQDEVGAAVSKAMNSGVSPFVIVGYLDFMKANVNADMRAVQIQQYAKKHMAEQKAKVNIIKPNG